MELVRHGFPAKSTLLPRELQPYFKIREDLTIYSDLILFQTRIVIPQSQRCDILQKLHLAHQGIERTKPHARQTVYWPGMNSDIINIIGTCTKCQENRPSLPAEKHDVNTPPTYPFQETAIDIFEYAGNFYLIYTDRFSGWKKYHSSINVPILKWSLLPYANISLYLECQTNSD